MEIGTTISTCQNFRMKFVYGVITISLPNISLNNSNYNIGNIIFYRLTFKTVTKIDNLSNVMIFQCLNWQKSIGEAEGTEN